MRRDRHPREHRDAEPVFGEAVGCLGVRDRYVTRDQQRAADLCADVRRWILRALSLSAWYIAARQQRTVHRRRPWQRRYRDQELLHRSVVGDAVSRFPFLLQRRRCWRGRTG